MRLTTERLALTPFDRERDWSDFVSGLVQGLVVWTMRTRDGAFVGVSGLMNSEPPIGGQDPEFGCLIASR